MATGSWDGAAQAAANGAATGFLEGTISGAINGAINSPYCFVAGTLVLTVVGTVAIETIQAGDMVWAWDEETGEVAPKEVVETYVNETYELIHVFVDGEEIVTTPAHPFYSPVKGWTNAVHLRAGDILVLLNGEYVIVEKIQHELLETPISVYNFEVEDYHTYYVSEAGVLVHNNCGDTGTYNQLKNANKGSGNEVHHIIEKRFVSKTNYSSAGQMQSVVLTKGQHRKFTNAWRKHIPYGSKNVTAERIKKVARIVYANDSKLLDLALSAF